MSKEETEAHDGVVDTDMVDVDTTQPKSTSSSSQAKRKKNSKHTTLAQFTIRKPAWAYIHLSLVPTAPTPTPATLDALTAQIQLQAALTSFLGLHGSAIPLDFLKIQNQDVWLRVPREDVGAVVAAVGGWVGKNGDTWRVNNWSCWGPDVGRNAGMDLFET